MIKKIINDLFGLVGYRMTRAVDSQVFNPFDLSSFVKKFITKENPIIFDVGANTGQSIEFFRKVFTDPTIYSFEPDEKCVKELKEKYEDDKVIIIPKALAEERKTAQLNRTTASKMNSFYSFKSDFREIDKVEIECETLDLFFKEQQLSYIDLLKIDVQGAEKLVLGGAKETLEAGQVGVICVEVTTNDYYYEVSNAFSDLEKYLKNYKLFTLCDLNYKDFALSHLDAIYVRKGLQ